MELCPNSQNSDSNCWAEKYQEDIALTVVERSMFFFTPSVL
jgi:hypothetical protein